MFNQRAAIAAYNQQYRTPFNKELFKRDDNEIIEYLKKVILSAQRDQFFVIKVTGFNVIDDYAEIQRRLREVEDKSNNKRKKFNEYDYINLKDSDVKLLEVFYHLETDGDEKGKEVRDISVLIEVPRVIDRYYFKLSGCYYSSMYQIVDGSTYNNTSMGSSKTPTVTMKSAFAKTSVHQMKVKLQTLSGETVQAIHYVCDIFSNKIAAEKFILCETGLNGFFYFMGLKEIEVIRKSYVVEDENTYVFPTKDETICVRVPKFLFDNSPVYQSTVFTLVKNIDGVGTFEDIYTREYWLESQGGELKTRTIQKGLSFKESFDVSVDIASYEALRTPEPITSAIGVLKWIILNFQALTLKDNCNIACKRVRFGEYIAIYYAHKLAYNIRRIANLTSKVSMSKLLQTVQIRHNFLIDQLKSRCTLISYNNNVNDNDAITALKYSFKGISGIGENKASAVQTKYKLVNISHLSRVDLTNSSNSDPGMTGTLVPYLELNNGALSDYYEPTSGSSELDKLYEEYRAVVGIKEVEFAKRILLGEKNDEQLAAAQATVDQIGNISRSILTNQSPYEEAYIGYPLNASGTLSVEYL